MTSAAIVNRYAGALVDVVVSPTAGIQPATALEHLRLFDATLKASKDLRLILASPAVSMARKRTVIRGVADALGLERIIRNFLLVLTDHRRASAISEVTEAFDVLLDERLGFARAEVATAQELDAARQQALTAQLAKLVGKQVRVRWSVDAGLIGGVTARVGSKVYDGSVRGQLAGIRQRLTAGV